LASIGAVARFEALRNGIFLNREKNARGIYGVRFYIRGKPWVLAVDDRFFFSTQTSPHSLKFGKSKDPKALWIPVMEKAWAKVKGNYANSQGGFVQTGFRYMTGSPFETYDLTAATYNSQAGVDSLWDTLNAAHALNYLLGAGTGGGGDTTTNGCGIVNGHAYSVIGVF
jgi:calpain-15